MFRVYSPGVNLFALVVAGFLSLFKPSKKTRRQIAESAPSPYLDRVRKVVASHTDCTAEVFNVFISGVEKVRIFSELIPGDRVELRLRNGEVTLYADGKYMSTPLLSDSSRLRFLLETDEEVEAFLGGRDVTSSSEDAEFCSIIAFYKIQDVPPTKIILE